VSAMGEERPDPRAPHHTPHAEAHENVAGWQRPFDASFGTRLDDDTVVVTIEIKETTAYAIVGTTTNSTNETEPHTLRAPFSVTVGAVGSRSTR
jgi:hypothetical protein